jgi:hypothetical protein
MPSGHFELKDDTFTIKAYNRVRTFASFLPGIAGPYGKPLWVFYTNRGQCISSFGVRNKDGNILEFDPATKAYQETALLGFRTFLRIREGRSASFYEPFRIDVPASVRQTLHIRPHEIELEESDSRTGLKINVVYYTLPNDSLPALVRDVTFENRGRKTLEIEAVDGLPRLVPFGLGEWFVKMMTRTMEAFAEIVHVADRMPLYKLKIYPADTAEVKWVQGGTFAFTVIGGKSQPVLVDPEAIFGADTTFQTPLSFHANRSFHRQPQRTESCFGSAFSHTTFTLKPGQSQRFQSYYGQVGSWEQATSFRERILSDTTFADGKRAENAKLIQEISDGLALSTDSAELNGYTRQTYLDNVLRGGMPCLIPQKSGTEAFHLYSRKHGDLERDYNFFELAPTYFSQGNGNFRDVNQNRRSDVLLHAGMKTGNIETFFNMIQLDGYNPLLILAARFYVEKDQITQFDSELTDFLSSPFQPGELYERLLALYPQRDEAYEHFLRILSKARKQQDAVHAEGFWVDHWIYNLDLLENFLAVYPDEIKALMIERRDFTYFDNDHIVLPRHKKYIQRGDGSIRQLHSVATDAQKQKLISQRTIDPHKVRTRMGEGPVYQTSLFVKMIGLIAVKLSTLDPFGIGIEMESEKPGWCDALNGLPGLFGSSINETLELRRWIAFLQAHLPEILAPGETHLFPVELLEFLKAVGEALAIARSDDFFKTWDTLASLRERFRERTRLGVSGEEAPYSREDAAAFLSAGVRVIEAGLKKAFHPNGLCTTYFIHEPVRFESLPATPGSDKDAPPLKTVKVLQFKQIPVSPFLEGPVHALKVSSSAEEARKIARAVKSSELYDKKLKMFKLNVPLTNESFEIGRTKIFAPGWLENESVFLHMAYKFLFEELRSGLVEEFYEDLKHQCVAFLDPEVYGRSPLENSSFIVSTRFPDARLHGGGFAARLTGAAAEWISIVLQLTLGAQPFQWTNGELRFEPRPTLAGWLFKKSGEFGKDTLGFKLFSKTWIVYRNPGRRNTYGPKPLTPQRYRLHYASGKDVTHEGSYLPDTLARDLRSAKLDRVTIDLG